MSAYLPRFFFFFFFNDTATTEIYTLSLHDALPISDIGTSVPISQSVIGRAFLAACTPPEREAVLNQMKVKERSEEHTSELQSRLHLVCRLLLEKKKRKTTKRKSRLDKTNRRRRRVS